MKTYKRINEVYLETSDIIDEKYGIINTDDSAFNKLVKKISVDTLKYPEFGNLVSDDDKIKSEKWWKYTEHKIFRKNVYTNTGIDWLPELNVYWFGNDIDKFIFTGYAFGFDSICIFYKHGKDSNYYEFLIAHELRHLHTNIIDEKIKHQTISDTNWKSKKMSIDTLEKKVYEVKSDLQKLDYFDIDILNSLTLSYVKFSENVTDENIFNNI